MGFLQREDSLGLYRGIEKALVPHRKVQPKRKETTLKPEKSSKKRVMTGGGKKKRKEPLLA